mmetsp:Transcript_35675/g.82911  ORF Transcript_35675/g.82911 Transcript_35675/m.82911 type:complete len:322 (+) Transcript_35675:79-1044(+)
MSSDRANPWVPVAMSLLAGLSTTLGAGIVVLLPAKHVSRGQMAFALALAGGVMMSVTVLEFWLPMIIGGKSAGPVFFFSCVGAGAFLLLSLLVPEPQVVDPELKTQLCPRELDSTSTLASNDSVDAESGHLSQPHERAGGAGSVSKKGAPEEQDLGDEDPEEDREEVQKRRCRLAIVLMLALTAHNFPEGFAVAISAMQSDSLGLVVMFAIAVHNIPEGISIALPVMAATGSPGKALWMSFLSGMAEPLGAMTALLVVRSFGGAMSEASMENLLCTVGGVMCAVAVKELLPEAFHQRRPAAAFSGMALGFVIMFVTSRLGA